MTAVAATPLANAVPRADGTGDVRPDTPTRARAFVAGREARSRLLAAAVVTAAVLAGGALGVAADRLVIARRPIAAARGLDAFAAELGLTAAQRSAVDSIMDARRRAIETIVAPVRPQLDAVRDAGRRDIRQRLTPAQQVRYDAYVARIERQERDERAGRR